MNLECSAAFLVHYNSCNAEPNGATNYVDVLNRAV